MWFSNPVWIWPFLLWFWESRVASFPIHLVLRSDALLQVSSPRQPMGPGCSWPWLTLPRQSWLLFHPPSCSWWCSRIGNTLLTTMLWAVPARIETTDKSCALQSEAFWFKRRGTSSPFSCQPHHSLCNTFTLWHLKKARICHRSCFIYRHIACALCIYGVSMDSLGLPRSLTRLPCWQHLPRETVGFPGMRDAGHIFTAGRQEQVETPQTSKAVVLQLSPVSLEHPI